MGLASSQARLLLLTARKSDLEYRSQMISQRKIMLAMETEALATDYTKALSDKSMNFVFDLDSTKGTTLTKPVSYNEVTSVNSNLIGNFIVTDAQGKMIVPTDDKNQVQLPEGFQLVTDPNDATKQYAYYKGKDGVLDTAHDQGYEIEINNGVLNPTFFQNSLRNGGMYLQKLNVDNDTYENKSWQALDVIQDQLNKDNDPVAQSTYEAKSLSVQNQDKMLDLELKQIETQHKAIETEYDSVKKVIDKNIEVSYKIFA